MSDEDKDLSSLAYGGGGPVLQGMLSSLAPNPDWGPRMDGSPKGNGFFGPLMRPDGNMSSELSIDFDHGGRKILAPLIVPTMSKDQLDRLLARKDGEPLPPDVVQNAQQHAIQRIMTGKPTFSLPNEVYPLPK